MGARPPRTTLPARYKRAQNVVENVRKSDLLKLNLYRLLPLDARFEKLMRLYDSISDWKKEYKKVEIRKPAAVRTPLNVENIEDVIYGAMYDDILELALSMHVANKIAHACDWAIEDIIENFLLKKVNSKELPETVLEDENATPIIRKIGRIFDPVNQGNPITMDWLRRTLGEYGITSRMLRDLEGCGLEELNQMQRNAFYIKDYEMENAIDLLKEKNVKKIKFICIIAAPEGLKRVQEKHPDVQIYCGHIDDHLNEDAYIVPGLGDAGDRIYGTK